MPRTGTIIFILGTIALTASAKVHAQDSSDMARCAELENADARLACYDEVVNQQVPAEADESAPATEPVEQVVPSAAGEPTPLSEEIGREQLSGHDKEPERFAGQVTHCRQDAAKKWYFFFDNGQVWKHPNNSRLRYKSCSFDVTIMRDFFGYKMQVDGEERWTRISRVR